MLQRVSILAATGAALLLLIGAIAAKDDDGATATTQWSLMGHDLSNSRSQPSETTLNVNNVSRLAAKWTFTSSNDVSATPTVADNTIYFSDWDGFLYAVRADTGQKIWSHQISDYNQHPGSISRVSPAIFGDSIIIGDNQPGRHNGAHIMSINRSTGDLRWITQVDGNEAAIITGSPVVNDSIVYSGVSSNEEGLASDNSYPCCTFRGSMVALNANTGALLWKTYVVPDNAGVPGGYSGNAIWQPPAIDTTRGLLYVGTGNNYTVPQSVLTCQKLGREDCVALDDYFDTALALDLHTGTIKWSHRVQAIDTWIVACTSLPTGANCQLPSSPDYDLGGSGPNLVGKIVGFGQKSGIYWALDPDTGNVVWSTVVGPGSSLGGIEWGTATDGSRIYVALTNKDQVSHKLQPNGPTITWGSWAALDPATGKILWQVPNPTKGATSLGSVSVANGVVYAASFAPGIMYALNAASGDVLWKYENSGSVVDSPSIVNGTLFWGSGYSHIRPGTPNNKVYAFAIPGSAQ